MARLKIGVIGFLRDGASVVIERARDLGLDGVQLSCSDPALYTLANVEEAVAVSKTCGVEINTVWAGGPGKCVWDFYEGPRTVGIVPHEHREDRIVALMAGADFAKRIGVASITSHVGFIPEDPHDSLYKEVVESLRRVTEHCRKAGVEFWFETGQETPVTLLRTIEDVAAPNMGVNLDSANLILYGKSNPVDALDVLGPYIRGVHAKDGLYPTNGRELGQETPLGEGKVDFPTLIGRLKSEFGFTGHLTIEREISGPRQIEDIKRAIELLRPLC